MDRRGQETFILNPGQIEVKMVEPETAKSQGTGLVDQGKGETQVVYSTTVGPSGEVTVQNIDQHVLYTQHPVPEGTEDSVQQSLHTVYAQLPAALREENGQYRHVYLIPQTGGNTTLGALSETLTDEQHQAILAMAVPVSSHQLSLGESQTFVLQSVGQSRVGGQEGDVTPATVQNVMVSSAGHIVLHDAALGSNQPAVYAENQVPVTNSGVGDMQSLEAQASSAMMYLSTNMIPQAGQDQDSAIHTGAHHKQSSVSLTITGRESLTSESTEKSTCVNVPEAERVTLTQNYNQHNQALQHIFTSPRTCRTMGKLQTSDPRRTAEYIFTNSEESKENMRHASKVFSSVCATLSDTLLKAIPGSKSAFLTQIEKDCHVNMQRDQQSNTITVCGDLPDVLQVQHTLNKLLDESNNPGSENLTGKGALQMSKVDKAVMCDILKPLFSRSGREVKRRNLDVDLDDLFSTKKVHASPSNKLAGGHVNDATGTGRRKRGRPRKIKDDNPKISANAVADPAVISVVSQEDSDDDHGADTETTVMGSNVELMESEQIVNIEAGNNMLAEIAATCKIELPGTEHEMDVDANNTVTLLEHDPSAQEVVLETLVSMEQGFIKPESNTVELEQEAVVTDHQKSTSAYKGKTRSSQKGATNQVLKSGQELLGRPKPKKDYERLAPFKFFCNLCSFKSKRESHFQNHKKLHEEKNLPLLHCKKCDFRTLRLGHLRRHELQHTNNLFHCSKCKYTTDDMKLLTRHYRMKHGGMKKDETINESDILHCSQCDYKTVKQHHMQRHIRIHADTNQNGDVLSLSDLKAKFLCSHCPYKTARKEHFSRHMNNVHSETRPFLCDLCGKSFKRPDALKQHREIHQEKTLRSYPYHCSICNKGFRSQAHLNEHRTIHFNIRSYLCEICGAAFKTKSVQKKHILTIHNNPRAYPCNQCSKRFNTKYALCRHVRTHNTLGMRIQAAMDAIVINQPEATTQELEAVGQDPGAMTAIDNIEVVPTTTIETYEENAEVSLQNLGQGTYIHNVQTGGDSGEAITAVVYLNLAPFELERVSSQNTHE